ncbi:sialic acid-binding Ig-like lectin 8 [Ochotona curzoniae]|uniref:sialic acid-binding Ig-like lectin 8 n=1 Tax=Ochotona curzoniae TaxID=130825 RepID=UPI001B34957E|nr:sialic acid-binding Ig-like lectin 8 [Ochotona curzoniae]
MPWPAPLLLLLLLIQSREEAQGQVKWQDLRLQVQGPVVVQEGLCVHVPCEFSYSEDGWTSSDPVFAYWFRDGASVKQDTPVATNSPEQKVEEESRGRFHLLGDPKTNDCSLNLTDARSRDVGTYFFFVERGKSTWSFKAQKLSVRVTALTHTPDIFVPGSLQSGHTSSLICSAPWACEQGTLPTFSWMGDSVSHLDPSVTHSSVLRLNPRPQDHGTNLTCQVTLPGAFVTARRTIRLSVSYPPQNVTVIVLQGAGSASTVLTNSSLLLVAEGQPLHLACVAVSHPPANLSWNRAGLPLMPSQSSDTGVLELPQVHVGDQGELNCRAQNLLGSQHVSVTLSLQRKGGPPAQVVQVAIGQAVAKILLLLGLCLVVLR